MGVAPRTADRYRLATYYFTTFYRQKMKPTTILFILLFSGQLYAQICPVQTFQTWPVMTYANEGANWMGLFPNGDMAMGSIINFIQGGMVDITVVSRHDQAGYTLWAHQVLPTNNVSLLAIRHGAITPAGNVAVCGSYLDNATGDAREPTAHCFGPVLMARATSGSFR